MKKLAYLLKTSRFLYSIYFYVMSGLIKFLGLFIRTDEKLILFNCYGGKKYDDSTKAVYEAMLNDDRFKDCRFCWALQEPDKFTVPGRATVVRSDTFKFFVTALKARVWVTNSSMERGLDFKKKKTFCFNTWHATPIKVMGTDIKSDNKSFTSKVLIRADIMCAQGQYDIDVYSRSYKLSESQFRITGLPRNDELAHYSAADVAAIRTKLGLPSDKIILLYCPTFREFTKGSSNEVIQDVPIDLAKWQEKLGDKYVVLFRVHYEVARHMNIDGYPMFIDYSSYPNLNELMIAADALISDYSSTFFDFSVMHKPMYCFAYDYEEYMTKRGMYIDIKTELPCTVHEDEDSLLSDLLNFESDKEALSARTAAFQAKYVEEYGHAAVKCCDIIYEEVFK